MRRKAGQRILIAAVAAAVAAMALCPCGCLAEEQEILLPDGVHYLVLPAEMTFQRPAWDETDLAGIYLLPPDLEMLIFAYDMTGQTLQSLAETLEATGRPAEIREVAGTEFLVFQETDESDGTSCVGYSYLTENQMIEISFFYTTQDAMDLTKVIMESMHT